MIDGFGLRNLIGDRTISLERARRAVESALAQDLGLGERLVPPREKDQTRDLAPSAAAAASRPVRTAPSM